MCIRDSPRWITYCVNCGTEGVNPPTPSNHRLRCGLPGYLILFATQDVYKRQALDSMEDPILHLAVHLTLVGALREGEIVGLTPEDIDFDAS